MYDGRFKKAKNLKGEYLRDQKTGDLVHFCGHFFILSPIFSHDLEIYAGFINEECRRFNMLKGVCRFCGEVLIISRENIVETKEEYEKEINDSLIEIGYREK